LADDRAKPMFNGLRTERLANAIRLSDVKHEALGDDMLTRGRIEYPEKLFIDETTFSLG
jgi:diaminohydroxyphosphoribosylaminopyrimidine deaminase/5-amino-6-(5-phosphoribosylamino)uracil reductase